MGTVRFNTANILVSKFVAGDGCCFEFKSAALEVIFRSVHIWIREEMSLFNLWVTGRPKSKSKKYHHCRMTLQNCPH